MMLLEGSTEFLAPAGRLGLGGRIVLAGGVAGFADQGGDVGAL